MSLLSLLSLLPLRACAYALQPNARVKGKPAEMPHAQARFGAQNGHRPRSLPLHGALGCMSCG